MTTLSEHPVGLTDELTAQDFWSDEAVQAAGFPVLDSPFVTVGGGMGSFVLVDYLRIAGVRTSQIRVLSTNDKPWHTYEHLTRASQVSRADRIRSDSQSRPDNIWGFPSYAVQEALQRKRLGPLLQVLVEPVLADFYTPRAGMVFESMQREANRIGYWDMLDNGQVLMVRRRRGGGYFTLLAKPDGMVAYRSRYVHLAVGYPGLNFLPELRELRASEHEFHRVVNAYEPHEHVYQSLRGKPGTVLVRGGGIVASRILERLMNDRAEHGLQTQILHLFRTFVDSAHGPHAWSRRKGRNGFAYQGFNYPKSVWGGQLKAEMRRLEGDRLRTAYQKMGGTSTAWRRSWQRQLRAGRDGGWYRTIAGTISSTRLTDDGRVVCEIDNTESTVDFIIDCTGLQAEITEHEVLDDLLTHGNAGRNPMGRLDVERSFELRGTANGDGHVYASGAACLGGYFPGVDTFLGLQIAAQEITDDLARLRFCRRIGPFRSLWQWFRWAANKPVR